MQKKPYFSFSFSFLLTSVVMFVPLRTLNIKTCNFSSYDQQYYQTLKLPMNKESASIMVDCLAKNATILSRKILVQNSSNTLLQQSLEYDQVYLSLAEALISETQNFIQNLNGNLDIKMQYGIHIIKDNDFLIKTPQIFRRSLVNITLSGESNQSTQILIKTNKFYWFISAKLLIYNVHFIGNDINWPFYENDCYNDWQAPCCDAEQFNTDYWSSDNLSACSYKNFPLFQIRKQNSYGLFNLEYVSDNNLNIQPDLKIISCSFENIYLLNQEGFNTLITLAPVSGIFNLEDSNVENCLFPKGMVYFSRGNFDQLYSENTILEAAQLKEEVLFRNVSLHAYNTYIIDNRFDMFLFELSGFQGNFSVSFCKFTNLEHINGIIKISSFKANAVFSLNDSLFADISEIINSFFIAENIQIVYISNVSIEIYQSGESPFISLSDMPYFMINTLNITNLSMDSQANFLQVKNSNIFFCNSFLNFATFYSFIEQEGNNLIISNSSFYSLLFKVNFISFTGFEGVLIESSIFSKIEGEIYLFVLYKGGHFILRNTLIEYVNIYSFFYFVGSLLNLNENVLIRKNSFGYIWEKDISCQQIITNYSEIHNNTITACLFRDLSIQDVAFSLLKVFIHVNNFIQSNSAGMIQTQMGSCTFDSAYFIMNYFLNYDIFRYLMEIAIYCRFIAKNSVFIDNGIIQKKISYFGFNDNCVIALWSIIYSHFDNILMVVTDNTEMLGGFISASPHYGIFELMNSLFISIITNNIFEYKGLQIDSFVSASIINNTFYNLKCNDRSFATRYGGVCLFASSSYAFSKGQNKYELFMRNNTFYNSSCVYGGGLAVFAISSIEIIDLFFLESQTLEKGGAFIVVGSENCSMANIFIQNSKGREGGGIFIQNIFSLKIDNISIYNATAIGSGILYSRNIPDFYITNIHTEFTSVGSKGGVFTIFRSDLILLNGNFFDSYSEIEGGVLYCDDRSEILLKNININNTFAGKAGAISIVNVNNFRLEECFIDHSLARNDGGAIILMSFVEAKITNLTIKNSRNINGVGMILIQNNDDSSKIIIHSLTCFNNYATDGSCILFSSASSFILNSLSIENNGNNPLALYGAIFVLIEIKQIYIHDCVSEKYIIDALNVILYMTEIKILENCGILGVFTGDLLENSYISNGIFSNNSYLQVFEAKNSMLNLESLTILGVKENIQFLFATDSNISIYNSNFTNGVSSSNLGLFQFSNTYFYSSHTAYDNNVGILMVFSQSIRIVILDSNFSNNSNILNVLMPNDLYIENNGEDIANVSIYNTSFHVFNGFSCLLTGNIASYLENCQFSNNLNSKNAVHAVNFISNPLIFLNKIKVLNFTDTAFYILNSLLEQSINIVITNSAFEYNKASKGSAIYLEGNMQITILDSTFSNNEAIFSNNQLNSIILEGVAPCIFFKPTEPQLNNSSIKIINTNFSNNSASFIAPTIFIQYPIEFSDNKLLFLNNQDSFAFTDKMFSFPLDVHLKKIISEGEAYENLTDRHNQTIIFNSGSEISLVFELVDYFNQRLIFDNSSVFTIRAPDSSLSMKLENSLSQISEGLIIYPNLVIKTQPAKNFSLVLSSSFAALPKEIPSQKLSFEFPFYSRVCAVGEIILVDDSCEKCPEKTYSLQDPMTVEQKYQKCTICPQFCECHGGDQITPLPGYYRKSNNSINVVQCFSQEACLGNAFPIENCDDSSCLEKKIHGACSVGNQGPLCSFCEDSYGKYEVNSSCKKCADLNWSIVLRLLGYVVFLCLYLFFNSYLAETYDSHSQESEIGVASVLLKIIINHIQQINLILLNGVALPFGDIKSFFDMTDFISFTNDQVVCNECIFQNIERSFIQINLFKIIMNSFLPLFLSLITFFVWILFFCCFRKKIGKNTTSFSKIYTKVMLFLVLSVFMFYPLIIRSCFGILDCMKLDPDVNLTYLKINLEIQCWTNTHLKYMLFLSIPGLIIWGLGLPFFLMFSLRKSYISSAGTLKTHKSSVLDLNESKNIKISFGTLAVFCKGYKLNVFYWEGLILCRKFLLCLLVTLNTSSVNDEYKWFFIILLFLYFLKITLKYLPFSHAKINNFEIWSLGICLFSTISCFSFNSLIYQSLKEFLCVVLILSNGGFLLYSAYSLGKNYLRHLKKLNITKKPLKNMIRPFKQSKKNPKK